MKDFKNAILDGANFHNVHIEGADFYFTKLKGTTFFGSHLDGATYWNTHLEEAIFHYTIVNGDTLFIENYIDTKTNFIGTSLSSARILPELKTQLERNIWQIRWEEWYKYNKMLEIPAKVFWKISDYGSSTLSILFTFLFSNVIFTMFYLALRDAGLLDGSILSSGNDLLLAYMQTTLVPLRHIRHRSNDPFVLSRIHYLPSGDFRIHHSRSFSHQNDDHVPESESIDYFLRDEPHHSTVSPTPTSRTGIS